MDDVVKFLGILKKCQVVKIYYGQDSGCRCGCNGKYLYRNDDGFVDVFVDAINAVNEHGAFFGDGWVNISVGDDKARCLVVLDLASVALRDIELLDFVLDILAVAS